MDVFQFFAHLFRGVDIEVVISALPESAHITGSVRELQRELAGRTAFSCAHGAGNPLLQDLDKLCEISFRWFA